MPNRHANSLTPAVIADLLRKHSWLWITPAIAGLLLTAVGTLLTPRKWNATQGMIVRSEAAGYADQRLGKFTDLSEMRTVQETVLEVARSRSVLTAALEEVGPPRSLFGRSGWPSAQDVEDLRENLKVSPPGGAEFGATEIFYLEVLDENPGRAVRIVDAVVRQVDSRMQQLRNAQAQSMVSELKNAAKNASRDLAEHTSKLAAIETEIGPDLADLRNLVSSLGNQGALTQKTLSIEAELRGNTSDERRARALLAAVKRAKSDPQQLLALPSELLASQPALEQLKAGLVAAQLRTAQMMGARTARHPLVLAAQESETRHREKLRQELPSVVAGIELEILLLEQRSADLRSQLKSANDRVRRLASRRAEYSMLEAAVDNQQQVVDAAQAQLADALAHSAGSNSASVLERVDTVEAGIRPVGPGRTTVSLAGGLAGLVLGVGLVFVLHAPRHEADPFAGLGETVRPGTWTEQFPPVDAMPNVWAEVATTGAGNRETVCAG